MDDNVGSNKRFADIVRQIMRQYTEEKPQGIHVIKLSKEMQIEKRRLYDLFNILAALKVCNRIDDTRQGFEWVDINMIPGAIKEIFIETELKVQHGGIRSLLPLERSPSLGSLTRALLSIYFLTGCTKLNVKLLVILFAEKPIKYKQMLRRLYLVAFFLEQVDILKRTTSIGEYQILFDLNKYSMDAFQEMATKDLFEFPRIASLMSQIGPIYIQNLQESRHKAILEIAASTNSDFFYRVRPKKQKVIEERETVSSPEPLIHVY